MILQAGDTFRYREKDYVYLVEYNDILYAARILDEKTSCKLNKLYEKKKMDGRTERNLEEKKSFCFVMLSTEELKNRAAHLGYDTEHDISSLLYDNKICSLDEADLRVIIREIKGGPVSGNLKKAFDKIYEET